MGHAGEAFRHLFDERERLLIDGDAEAGPVVRPHFAILQFKEFGQYGSGWVPRLYSMST